MGVSPEHRGGQNRPPLQGWWHSPHHLVKRSRGPVEQASTQGYLEKKNPSIQDLDSRLRGGNHSNIPDSSVCTHAAHTHIYTWTQHSHACRQTHAYSFILTHTCAQVHSSKFTLTQHQPLMPPGRSPTLLITSDPPFTLPTSSN